MTELTNSIGYSGEVTVKLTNSKSYHIHNLGHKALWNLLAMAVAGYDVSNNAPRYFMISSRTGDGKPDKPCLLSQLPFLGTVWGDVVDNRPDRTSTRFTVTVTKNNRIWTIKDGEVAVLQMFNRKGELLAEVVDTEDRVIAKSHNSMISGVNAIYEWKMTFLNVSSEPGGNSDE